MSFEAYIRTNYVAACEEQRRFDHDRKMKSMLARGDQDIGLVKSWMEEYNLFQGITTEDRKKIVNEFLSFAITARATTSVADKTIFEEKYSELFRALFFKVNRSWMSATSKLLWCIYPDEVVICDSFVERALVVLQCLDSDLASFPRIGVAKPVARESDIGAAVKRYMNCRQIVWRIFERNSATLHELREKHEEEYPHDIRIIDKLLWMIGNPNLSSSV